MFENLLPKTEIGRLFIGVVALSAAIGLTQTVAEALSSAVVDAL